ncbi:unnamed protein product [Staurois parvus]|uniref:Galectin n=1 Tax=Staurois parvus TaxID=386267 RepID=A0ABN9ELC2_9NEOB|nr:unnamed protein product [Staurois parvus]
MGIDQKNLVLHFNPRFDANGDKQKIILNSKQDSVWGAEKRESFFPFEDGSDIKVCFKFEQDKITIKLSDGKSFSFPVRFPILRISYLAVQGFQVMAHTIK